MSLDDVLSKREEMNDALRTKLDDVTERWGVKVSNVEVREIKPPPAVLEAMKTIGTAPSIKFVVPAELTNLLAGLAGNLGNGAKVNNGSVPLPQ